MKLNKEQLEKINKGINAIFDFCPIMIDDNEELIFSEERIKEIVEEEKYQSRINNIYSLASKYGIDFYY